MARRTHASKLGGSSTLLTIKQAAEVLGVAEITLRRWDDTGKFPARRHPINGYRLYELSEVKRLRAAIVGAAR